MNTSIRRFLSSLTLLATAAFASSETAAQCPSSWRNLASLPATVDITATAAGERGAVTLYALNTDGSLWRGTVAP